MDPFDYLKVYLNGSHLVDLHRGNNYKGPDGDNILQGDGNLFEYMIGGLAPSTSYTVKVVPYLSNGDYGKTYEASATTKAPAPVVTPPTNIRATANGLMVTITFTKGANNDKVEISDYEGSRILKTVTGTTATINLADYGYLYDKEYTLRLRGISGNHKTDWVYTNRFKTGSKPIEGLKEGDSGSEVRKMNELLHYLGHLVFERDKSDVFTAATTYAVMEYKRVVGIEPVDGIIDDNTKKKLTSSAFTHYKEYINKVGEITNPPVRQQAKSTYSNEEKNKSLKYDDVSYWGGRPIYNEYELVGRGIAFSASVGWASASHMSIYYNKDKVSSAALAEHSGDWEKPFVYIADGASLGVNALKQTGIEAAKLGQALGLGQNFKLSKVNLGAETTYVEVYKRKGYNNFNPTDIEKTGWTIGGAYGIFKTNIAPALEGDVVVVNIGFTTPGKDINIAPPTNTKMMKKQDSDRAMDTTANANIAKLMSADFGMSAL